MQPHEVSADMAALSPEACDYVRQLARRLDEAEHGSGTAMVREAGEFLGLSVRINTDADPRSGAVTIRYRTLDQLDLICQRLTGGGI